MTQTPEFQSVLLMVFLPFPRCQAALPASRSSSFPPSKPLFSFAAFLSSGARRSGNPPVFYLLSQWLPADLPWALPQIKCMSFSAWTCGLPSRAGLSWGLLSSSDCVLCSEGAGEVALPRGGRGRGSAPRDFVRPPGRRHCGPAPVPCLPARPLLCSACRSGSAVGPWRHTRVLTSATFSPSKHPTPASRLWPTVSGQPKCGWMNLKSSTTIAIPMPAW